MGTSVGRSRSRSAIGSAGRRVFGVGFGGVLLGLDEARRMMRRGLEVLLQVVRRAGVCGGVRRERWREDYWRSTKSVRFRGMVIPWRKAKKWTWTAFRLRANVLILESDRWLWMDRKGAASTRT